MKVNNLKEFLVEINDEEDFSEVERATFKYANCGAWITESRDKGRFHCRRV